MAFGPILKSAIRTARMMGLAPLVLAPLALTAPAQAQSVGVGVQTCTVVLFVEVCTGGGASAGSAAPAPAPMLGGSVLSLLVLGGFVALRRRMKPGGHNGDLDLPCIED